MRRCSIIQAVSHIKGSLGAPTQINNRPTKVLSELSKSLVIAWCLTIANDVGLGICVQRIDTHQDITATTARNKPMRQKVQRNGEQLSWSGSEVRHFVFMSAPTVRGGI